MPTYDWDTTDGRIISITFPDGYEPSDEELRAEGERLNAEYIKQMAMNPGTEGLVRQGPNAATPYPKQAERSGPEQFGASVFEGVSGNFGDEILAGLFGNEGEYGPLRRSMSEINRVEASDKPWTTLAGNIAGAAPLGAAGAVRGQALGLGTGAKNAAVTGGVLGALEGAGAAEPGSRTVGGLSGTIAGGLGGAVLGGLGNKIDQQRTSTQVQKGLSDLLESQGRTADDVIAARAAAGPDTRLADLDSMAASLEQVAPRMRSQDLDGAIERAEKVYDNLALKVRRLYGNDVDALRQLKKTDAVREDQAKPLYKQAFVEGASMPMTRNVQFALRNPYAEKGLKKLVGRHQTMTPAQQADPELRLAVGRPKPDGSIDYRPTLQGLHEMAKIMRSDASEALRNGNTAEYIAHTNARNLLIKEIERASPNAYREARKIWAETSALDDALKAGKKMVFDKEISPAELKQFSDTLPLEESRQFRLGVGEAATEYMRSTPVKAITAQDTRFMEDRLAAVDPARAKALMETMTREGAKLRTGEVAKAAQRQSEASKMPGARVEPPKTAYGPIGVATRHGTSYVEGLKRSGAAKADAEIGRLLLHGSDEELLRALRQGNIPVIPAAGGTAGGYLGGLLGGLLGGN